MSHACGLNPGRQPLSRTAKSEKPSKDLKIGKPSWMRRGALSQCSARCQASGSMTQPCSRTHLTGTSFSPVSR